MLKREAVITNAKLHALTHAHILGERNLQILKSELRQVIHPAPLRLHMAKSQSLHSCC